MTQGEEEEEAQQQLVEEEAVENDLTMTTAEHGGHLQSTPDLSQPGILTQSSLQDLGLTSASIDHHLLNTQVPFLVD